MGSIFTLHSSLLFRLLLLNFYLSNEEPDIIEANCTIIKDCSKCIQNDQCFWCSDININNNIQCMNKKDQSSYVKCKNVELQKNSIQAIEQDETSQINPSMVHSVLFPGAVQTIDIKVNVPNSFPLDLYLLMDLSTSMFDDLATVIKVTSSIVKYLSLITPDFRIGMGAFNEKYVTPFTAKLLNPESSVASYKHFISMTNDVSFFETVLRGLNVYPNRDMPEATFDALVQAVVCTELVGWRSKSRKIILVITDALPQMSGNELVGNIFQQNDGSCKSNYGYWFGNDMGYPSLSLLSELLKEKSIYPIFAVANYTNNFKPIVDELKQTGAVIDQLKDSSTNLVELLQDNYKKIFESIEVITPKEDNILFETQLRCTKSEDEIFEKKSICTNIKLGDQITLRLTIKSLSCSIENKNGDFEIIFSGFGSCKLRIDTSCSCECEKLPIIKNDQCDLIGSTGSKCGICQCFDNFFGSTCNCPRQLDNLQLDKCKSSINDQIECSGNGICSCNKCICNKFNLEQLNLSNLVVGTNEPIYYGSFCECDDMICPSSNEFVCSKNGHCKCGECQCNEGWTGVSCSIKICSFFEAKCMKIDIENEETLIEKKQQ